MCKIPVEQTGLLTMEQLDQMFSNVQDIYEYNCKFLKKLEAAFVFRYLSFDFIHFLISFFFFQICFMGNGHHKNWTSFC